MATNTIPTDTGTLAADGTRQRSLSTASEVRRFLAPLASLKLTVVLFAMSIFIILAGTLAQVDMDINQVIDEYFRSAIAKIEFQVFFPPSFFPNMPPVPGWFPFPGGWMIGAVMAVNLLAAHGVRFKVQAKGMRRNLGLGVIAIGIGMIWLVVASGSNPSGIQEASMNWPLLWRLFQVGLGSLCLATLYALFVLDKDRGIERWSLITAGVVLGGLLCWILYQGDAAKLGDSSMRILWQLTKGLFAGLTLLGGCVMLFKKRAGIVLLHGGIGLLMFSELLVGTTAVEAQMPIQEGETVNYVIDINELELAVVDRSHPEEDEVVVIGESSIKSGDTITHEFLPFDVKVIKLLENSTIRRLKPDEENPADKGAGLRSIVEKARPGSGTDAGGEVDIASAYVQFTAKGGSESLGTYLLSQYLNDQSITVGDKTYDVALRFKRTYKPYAIHLVDVHKDDYIGTTTPKNYSSDVLLVDESRNTNRNIKIWMNNPLRYAGETFYQQGYQRDPTTGVEGTTLSVVTNTGWMIPYVSCMLVATGLLAHFSIILVRFLNRKSKENQNGQASMATNKRAGKELKAHDAQPNMAAMVLPAVLVVVFAGYFASKARPPAASDEVMNLYEFGKIPLVYQGRVKPVDTLARNSLRIISEKQSFKDDDGEDQPAIRWFLDAVSRPEVALRHKVFRIENLDVQQTLGLTRREHFRYAFSEFGGKLDELSKQSDLARALDPAQLSIYQKKVLELENKIGVLDLLFQSYSLPTIRPEHVKDDFLAAIGRQEALIRRGPPLAIPPRTDEERWETYSAAWTKDLLRKNFTSDSTPNPATLGLSKILDAYANQNVAKFNDEVAHYTAALPKTMPEEVDVRKTNFEAFFNHFEPFYYSSVVYVFAFCLAACSWLGWARPLNRAAFWLIALTLLVHTFAIVARVYISGRPMVTNLYSAAVFIGWAGVVLGIILEAIFRIGIGNAIASVVGFATLLIAHFLSGDGDTFVVLQAVLDTQFWLATHVTVITLGYSTTFVAGSLGVLYVLGGVLTPSLSPAIAKDLSRMIYGTLCFAIFFSFVGTVLGGLWADDSWGRFWGWDPKENGALIIVVWNALVLHARWGGMVKSRGMAVLAVAGNITTSWSMFGVNELGVGLHSYGFTEGVIRNLFLFVGSQLAIVALGCIPLHMWMSSRNQTKHDLSEVA